MACPDDVSTKAEKEPKLVVGDPGPVACAGGTVRSVGTAWRQLSPDLRGHVKHILKKEVVGRKKC